MIALGFYGSCEAGAKRGFNFRNIMVLGFGNVMILLGIDPAFVSVVLMLNETPVVFPVFYCDEFAKKQLSDQFTFGGRFLPAGDDT